MVYRCGLVVFFKMFWHVMLYMCVWWLILIGGWLWRPGPFILIIIYRFNNRTSLFCFFASCWSYDMKVLRSPSPSPPQHLTRTQRHHCIAYTLMPCLHDALLECTAHDGLVGGRERGLWLVGGGEIGFWLVGGFWKQQKNHVPELVIIEICSHW